MTRTRDRRGFDPNVALDARACLCRAQPRFPVPRALRDSRDVFSFAFTRGARSAGLDPNEIAVRSFEDGEGGGNESAGGRAETIRKRARSPRSF